MMERKPIKLILSILLVFLIIFMTACSQARQSPVTDKVSKTNIKMDTVVSITLYDWEDSTTIDRAMDEIDRLEALLSVQKEGSELYKLAESAGTAWIAISPETSEVLNIAKKYLLLSNGYFNITVGPLVSLWDIHNGKGHYPNDVEREAAIEFVTCGNLLLKEDEAYLECAGMRADLGAIAKGYIADKVKELLLNEGVEHAIIDLGRNILLIGGKPDGSDFNIGVQDPLSDEGEILTVLNANDKSIVTSGIYERYFEYEGVRYHHILDPYTGYPSDSGLASVTIVSDTSTAGDALSTTCLLLGLDEGMELIESLPETEALFMTTDGEVYMTDIEISLPLSYNR
jgi:thiamine biosynthesis lipoprotein